MDRNKETGRFQSPSEEFICSDCNYRTLNGSTARAHRRRYGHEINQSEDFGDSLPQEVGDNLPQEVNISNPNQSPQAAPITSHRQTMLSSEDELMDSDVENNDSDNGAERHIDNDGGIEDGSIDNDGGIEDGSAPDDDNEYYPFQNFSHFLLCMLYHGSHNHKISQQVIKVLLLGFKQFTDKVPTLQDVTNFKFPYWEDKLLRKVDVNGDIFSFLSPPGLLAMRMAHPLYSKFDKLPYCVDIDSEDRGERQGQSSGEKWWDVARCNSFVLNGRQLFQGDTFLLDDQYARISQFFKNKDTVYARVTIYSEHVDLDSSPSDQEVINLSPHLYCGKQICENIKIDKFKNILSLREKNVQSRLSSFKFTKNEDDLNFLRQEITPEDEILHPIVLQSLLDEGHCVRTGVNVHTDDASMNPQSKVWKAATCISLQLAGAPSGPGGWKHGDGGTSLLAVAPCKQMSPIQVLETMRDEFNILQSGFSAYDFESKTIVKVKAGVCVFQSDLESQRQVTPFKGAAGYSFCHKDMMNTKTTPQQEENLVMRTREQLDIQIQEILNASTQTEKKKLSRQYGVVPSRYPPVTDMFRRFDLFSDFGCDTLHLLLLGVDKKFLVCLEHHVTDIQLQKAAAVVDSVMHPILYQNRPSGHVVTSPASQIGRSIKAVFQVLHHGLHLAGCSDIVCRAAYNLAEVNCLLFTESDVTFDVITLNRLEVAIQRCLATIERDFGECKSAKSHYVKKHILPDIHRHGNPSSYNTQGGERMMKVEKIAQQYSNKLNTNRDSTIKLCNVEIVRHIVTGGILSDTGEKCGPGVALFIKSNSCQDYLGLPKDNSGYKLQLADWRNGSLIKSRPHREHIQAGCPDIPSSTWKRLTIFGNKHVRGGGVKYRQSNRPEEVGIIRQIYKNSDGVFVIVQKLVPILVDNQFISFTEAKCYDLSQSFILVENHSSLKPHILLHACSLEDSPCPFVRSGEKWKLECVGTQGSTFLHNNVALARYN